VPVHPDSFLISGPHDLRDQLRELPGPDPGQAQVNDLEDPDLRPTHRLLSLLSIRFATSVSTGQGARTVPEPYLV
jgi:hypothetical protein